jgi:hypothetical protein
MSDQELVIRISAKNLTSEEFTKARKEVAGLNDEVAKQNKSLKDSEKYWEGVGAQIGDVMVTASKAGVIVAGAIGAMVAGVIELGKRGADVQDIRDQFDVLNETMGNDSKQAISTLSTAVDGVVSKFDLMKITNKALSAGMEATNEDFKTMGEGARVLADRVGGDTKEAYEAITHALATGKTARLAEIGLNIDETRTLKAHADALNIDAADMTEHQKKTALQVAIMKELTSVVQTSGRATLDFGDAFQVAQARISDWIDDLSAGIANSKVLGAALQAAGEIVKDVFGSDNKEMIASIVHVIEFAAITMVEWGRTAVTAGDLIARVFSGTQVVFDAVGAAVARVGQYFFKLVSSLDFVASKIPGVNALFGDGGKSAGEMADYLGGVADGFEHAGGAALQSAVGTRDSNDIFVKLDKTLKGVRDSMTDAMAATDGDTESSKKNTVARRANNDEGAASNKLLDEYNKKMRELTAGLKSAEAMGAPIEFVKQKFGSTINAMIADASILGKKVPDIVRDAFLKITLDGASDHMAKELERVNKELEEKVKRGYENNSKAFVTNLNAESSAYASAIDTRNKMTMNSYEYEKSVILKNAADKKDALDKHGEHYAEAMKAIDLETEASMSQAAMTWKQKTEEMEASTHSLANLTNKWLGSIPNLITAAFTGGGGMGGALKGLLGQAGGDLGSKMFEAGGLLNGLGNKLTGVFGTGLGLALPGIGGAIGSMLGPLAAKFGGFLKGIFGGSEESKLVNKPRDAFIAQFGNLDGLNQQVMKVVTGSLKLTQDLLGAKTEGQYKAAVDAINTALGEFKTKLEEVGKQEKTVTDRLLTLHDMTPELQSALNDAFNAKNPDEYAAALARVTGVMDETDAKQQKIDATLQKYGLDWTALGEKARASKLGEIARGLVDDFETLRGTGANMNVVMEGMKKNVQDFVNSAKKTGTEVPASMKPLLQTAIDAGTLFDENGKKIEKMDELGLTFAETLTAGFDRVVNKLDEVFRHIGLIGDATQTAASKVPDNPYANWGVPGGALPDVPTGGDSGVPAFATEAYVRRPTLAVVGDRPEGELVLSPNTVSKWLAQAANTGAASQGGGGGARSVNVTINTVVANADQLRQLIYKEIGPKLIDWLQTNKDNALTDMQAVLGVA